MRIKKYLIKPGGEKTTLKGVVKNVLICGYVLLSPINYLLVFIHSLFGKKRSFKYEVSLCLIFKNEAKVLREWIEYHRLVGVDHFYLYNNFSEDDYMSVLAPYIEEGIVTLTEWPYKYAQVKAYQDCYQKAKHETHWLGYIDSDEFVNLLKDNDIKSYLNRYKAYPAVYLYWQMFGTSGMLNEPKEYLMTEQFTACWPWLCNVGKTFINNQYGKFKIVLHQHIAYMGLFPLFPIDDRRQFRPLLSNPLADLFNYSPRAVLNHYWSRSYEFYKYKDFERGDADSVDNIETKKTAGRFELHELNNSTRDYSIQRWLVLLKKRLG